MDTCIHIVKYLHCSPEIITILFIDYTPIHDKKFLKKEIKEERTEELKLSSYRGKSRQFLKWIE